MRKLVVLLASGLLIFGVACGGNETQPAANEDEETTEETTEEGGPIEVAMTEFAFAAPETVPAGKIEVTAVNNGEQPHFMAVVPLKEGAPPIEELLKLSEKELEKYMAGPFGGFMKAIKPGAEKTFTLDGSETASFAFACFVEDPKTKKPHAQLGMVGSFEVES